MLKHHIGGGVGGGGEGGSIGGGEGGEGGVGGVGGGGSMGDGWHVGDTSTHVTGHACTRAAMRDAVDTGGKPVRHA